jgi:hypothetical protein
LDLQVHHITPVKEGGTHNLENLAVLCNNCHQTLHRQHDDKQELRPGLIDDGRPTFDIGLDRIEISRLSPCCEEIVEILRENGPMQLKTIASESSYAKGTVNDKIHHLKSHNYVARVRRGVYGYITTLGYRQAMGREPDDQGRRDVDVYDPGRQSELTAFSDSNSEDGTRR